jgi:hypothetical protein
MKDGFDADKKENLDGNVIVDQYMCSTPTLNKRYTLSSDTSFHVNLMSK